MKTRKHVQSFLLYAGALLTTVFINSCSNDDDGGIVEKPTGSIIIFDQIALSGNILRIHSVKVGQDSWLAAVPEGEETSNNFIVPPVLVEKGTTINAQLIFDETIINDIDDGHRMALKLYADNQNGGTRGAWDASDEAIRLANNELLIKTITVYPDDNIFNWFGYYDTNEDGYLNIDEILNTYPSAFEHYGMDHITLDQFNFLMYYSTTQDINNAITEEAWNEGYLRMYRNWADDNFSDFDLDENNFLNLEEWQEIFKESGWFEFYDTNSNSLLTEAELNTGLFSDWDLNNDGTLDENEFDHYRPFALGMAFHGPWDY